MRVLLNSQFLIYKSDNYLNIWLYFVIVYAVEVNEKQTQYLRQTTGWNWSFYSMRVYTISISLQ